MAGEAFASVNAIDLNNTPAETTEIPDEVVLIGTMEDQDQDSYKWTVSNIDA